MKNHPPGPVVGFLFRDIFDGILSQDIYSNDCTIREYYPEAIYRLHVIMCTHSLNLFFVLKIMLT